MSLIQDKNRQIADELHVLRIHLQWAGPYAAMWAGVTFVTLGGTFLVLEFFDAGDRVRLLVLVTIATLVLVNAIWMAAAVLLARHEMHEASLGRRIFYSRARGDRT